VIERHYKSNDCNPSHELFQSFYTLLCFNIKPSEDFENSLGLFISLNREVSKLDNKYVQNYDLTSLLF
jgi:hypothetical protein